ncbi:hypothetical protein ACKKBF_B40580 [Auxenochlorella protothecoides x Auxenochlorella symbiontica]
MPIPLCGQPAFLRGQDRGYSYHELTSLHHTGAGAHDTNQQEDIEQLVATLIALRDAAVAHTPCSLAPCDYHAWRTLQRGAWCSNVCALTVSFLDSLGLPNECYCDTAAITLGEAPQRC